MRFAISYRYGALGGDRGRASQTTLGEDITDSETGTVAVGDGSGFPVGAGAGTVVVLIGREYVEVNPDPANDQMDIVTRGVRGTTAASHSDGDRVQYTPGAVRKAVAARAGQLLIQDTAYRSWLPDADAEIDESEMADMMGATWDRIIEAMS
jgi:hypothetical protein